MTNCDEVPGIRLRFAAEKCKECKRNMSDWNGVNTRFTFATMRLGA